MKGLLVFTFAILFISCISNSRKINNTNEKRDSNTQNVGSLTMQSRDKNMADSILHSPPVTEDTIVHPFHITYTIHDNDDIVFTDRYATADRSLILSVNRAGKSLVSNKEIRKQNFDSIIPQGFIDKAQLYAGIIWNYDNTHVEILINICIPDTDICCPVLLSIDSLGHFTAKEEILDDME